MANSAKFPHLINISYLFHHLYNSTALASQETNGQSRICILSNSVRLVMGFRRCSLSGTAVGYFNKKLKVICSKPLCKRVSMVKLFHSYKKCYKYSTLFFHQDVWSKKDYANETIFHWGSFIMQCAFSQKQKSLQRSKVERANHKYRSNFQALHPHL